MFSKLFFSSAFVFFCSALTLAQNVGINETGAAPENSAILDVSSPDKGVLVPRVALTSATDAVTIASPAVSLLIYNTATAGVNPNMVSPGYYYWDENQNVMTRKYNTRRLVFAPVLLTIIALWFPVFGQAQSRLMINNNAFIVIDNGAKLILENPSTNVITELGSGANIVSEGENNAIVWEIGTSVGAYTVPFATTPTAQGGNGTKIPYTLSITAAGYTTKPANTMTFRYDDEANEIGGTNSINEAGLRAQRFNTNTNSCGSVLFGVPNAVTNTVMNVSVAPKRFFRYLDLGR